MKVKKCIEGCIFGKNSSWIWDLILLILSLCFREVVKGKVFFINIKGWLLGILKWIF